MIFSEVEYKLRKAAEEQPDLDKYIAENGSSDYVVEAYPDVEEVVDRLTSIHNAIYKPMKEIITDYGYTQAAFSKKFFIPLRTVESWCMKQRECPVYVRMMIMKILEMKVDRLTTKELKACKLALFNCDFESTRENLARFLEKDWLSINQGRDGNNYAWLYFDENTESCIRVNDLQTISGEEIHDLLC